MIPARLGSTRVKNKNLRLIDQKPLIQYIIDTAKKSKYLNDIYVNSEALIFKEISNDSGVHFYHRDKSLSTDKATNDDFTLDFINNIECDIIIQLLATSPFITVEEIDGFIDKMVQSSYDTLISVNDVRIEAVYKNQPINFEQKKQSPPSQELEPVKAYACGIMGWKTENFKKNMENYRAAYHGGDGKIGFYELKGFSTVDIDNEEDFVLAQAIVQAQNLKPAEPTYYQSEGIKKIFDANVAEILKADGVLNNNQETYNLEKVNIEKLINKYGRSESWSHTVINSQSNSATLIAQLPGEGNRMHFHHDWDEWWYIIEGEWEWKIEGVNKIIKAGEVVFIKRNREHKITAAGNKMAIRLAVSRYDVDHVYTESNY